MVRGLVESALCLESPGKVEMRVAEIRVEKDGFAKIRDPVFRTPAQDKRLSQVIESDRASRLEPQRLGKMPDRFFEPGLRDQDRCEVVVRSGILRSEPDCLAQLRRRLVESILLDQQQREVVSCL